MSTSDASDARAGRVLLAVTWLRVALVPVVMWLVGADGSVDGIDLAASALFLIASLTDLVDGFLARRWARTSPFGSFLDTTADKLLVAGTLIALVEVGRADPWITAIIIGREFMVLGLKGVVASQGNDVQASTLGKWKAVVQFIAIAAAIARPDVRIGALYVDQVGMLVAAAITVASAVDYLGRFRGALSSRP